MMTIPVNRLLPLVLAAFLLPAAQAANTVVKMDIAFGNGATDEIFIELFDDAAPVTVANFRRYMDDAGDRRYDGTFIHRSVPGFVIQGGGYSFSSSQGPVPVQTYPPIVNEFDPNDDSRKNRRGTIAMAKLPTGPDTATSQWFFNLADNANLDDPNTNGGFTVFGKVIGGGMQVVDRIAALPVTNLPLQIGGPPQPVPYTDFNNGLVDNNNLVQVIRVDDYAPPAAPVIQLRQSGQLDLGDIPVGTTDSSGFTVANLGNAPLTFTAGFSGPDAAVFSATHSCGSLQYAEECVIDLNVSPIARGPLSAQLDITSNGGDFNIPVIAYASGDNDGVPDNIESLGPNNGDANRDGIDDVLQGHVTAFPNIDGDYVVLETSPGIEFTNVRATLNPSPLNTPVAVGGDLAFNAGFYAFNIENIPPGGSATVTMTLPGGQPNQYFKYGLKPGDDAETTPRYWYAFNFNGTTGAEFQGNRVILHFVDGGVGDADGEPNGVIVDPGAPATLTGAGNTSTSIGGGGGCTLPAGRPARPAAIELLLLLTGLLGWRFYRRSGAVNCRH